MMTDPIRTAGIYRGDRRSRVIRGCSCTCDRVSREFSPARRRGSSTATYVVASDQAAPVGRGFRLTLTMYPSATVHESAASEAVSP